jgi:quinoprotein glucose dehydrogenase
LVDLPIDGQIVPALIQPTKRGHVFLLDRRDGKPLAQVEEKQVPQGPAPGDFLSPTQPFSTGMPVFDDTLLSERTMWGLTPIDQLWCRIKFRQARYDGPLTPPGVEPTIAYPGYVGGIEWGSVAVDPERRLMVVNWNRVANYMRLIPRADADAMGVRVSPEGKLPRIGQPAPQAGTPFALATEMFLSPLMVPCTEPPFGNIAVVDLDQRKKVWERPLGTSRDTGPLGIAGHLPLPMGVPNLGGSVTTRSGLVFIAAAQESAIRAFDIRDGRKLWSARLPAGGQATPMTFVSPRTGRQYVVISAGGHRGIKSKIGDYVVAYALP